MNRGSRCSRNVGYHVRESGDDGQRRVGADRQGETLADRADSPFDHAAQAEVRERVEAALRQLPEAFRTVVILREIEGFAYEEIAEILSVNLGTVKSRLTRGRSALRALLSIESVIPSTNAASYPSAEASKELVKR